MIKSNKEVTLETREFYFLHRKRQKLKKIEEVPRKFLGKIYLKISFRKNLSKNFSLLCKSRSGEKNRKVATYRRNNKLGVSFKNGLK